MEQKKVRMKEGIAGSSAETVVLLQILSSPSKVSDPTSDLNLRGPFLDGLLRRISGTFTPSDRDAYAKGGPYFVFAASNQ